MCVTPDQSSDAQVQVQLEPEQLDLANLEKTLSNERKKKKRVSSKNE
jgi:hypothetical protein